jgi:hypothetical protein
MRYLKKNWVLYAFIFGLTLCWWVPAGMAEEDGPLPDTAVPAYNAEQGKPSVTFETEGDFFLGYRWVTTEDSLKAAEYIYPNSSAVFGLNLLSAPLPYRYHINGGFFSKHDFYGDAGFAYKDLVLFRDILVGVHHNLDHYNYDFSDGIHNDNNPGDLYYIDYVNNLMSLRLKTPDFPFHAFVNHSYIEREGKIQQRYYESPLNPGDPVKISESRNIDWESSGLKLGANSHLGPVEIEYAYDQDEFDPGINYFLGPASDPHHVVAETESSAHTIKMHSSFTGGIVAAAKLSKLFQKNNYSLTESSTWKGAFDLSWMPDPIVGFYFKYRHRDLDLDTPTDNSARQGISYDKDVFSLSSRYKPLQRLSLFAKYEFSRLERKEITDWVALTPQTKIQVLDLRAHAKPIDKVKVKAIYEYRSYDQPAYNITPDKSNKLRLTTAYTPSPLVNIYLEYALHVTEGDFYNDPSTTLLASGERDGKRDQFIASFTSGVTPKLSLTFSWFYERWEIEQDLAYGNMLDPDVSYNDKANSFSFSFLWFPGEDITVAGDLAYTITKGTTGYNDTFSLSSLTDLETTETSLSFDITKKLPKDWETGIRLYYDIFDDKPSGHLDGNVFTTTFTLKRHF